MFTLCLYTDSALIHSVSFQQQTFPSSPNGFHRISRCSQPPKSVQEQIGFEHLSRSSVMTVQNFLLIFFTNSLIILILFDFHCIIFYHLVRFPNFHIFDLDVFGLRRWCQRKDAPRTIQNSAHKSIGDIPRTSMNKWTIRHTVLCILGCFEMFGRAEILWLVIDWSIDPNIILQFMKITTTQSLAGILIFHDLAVFLLSWLWVSTKKTQFKRRKLPKMKTQQKCEFSRSQLGAFTTILSMRFLASLESQWSGKSNWGPSARPGKTTQRAYVHYVHDLAAWLDVVWPSLNFKQMSAGWDVFLAVQAANLLVDSAYCPVAAHLRKETIFTAKPPAIILTAWGPRPP